MRNWCPQLEGVQVTAWGKKDKVVGDDGCGVGVDDCILSSYSSVMHGQQGNVFNFLCRSIH